MNPTFTTRCKICSHYQCAHGTRAQSLGPAYGCKVCGKFSPCAHRPERDYPHPKSPERTALLRAVGLGPERTVHYNFSAKELNRMAQAGEKVRVGRDRSTSGHVWREQHAALLALPGYQYLSHGHYRVTDAIAGRLAKDAGGKLPAHGMEMMVGLPNGESAWLSRTHLIYGEHRPPKRGWVWSVRPL